METDLQALFSKYATVTAIFRGDCTKRGYLGTALYTEGRRFDLQLDDSGGYTFIADRVRVKPAGSITQGEFARNVNGPMVAPLLPEDEGDMTLNDLCTVIEFRPETRLRMPPCWKYQRAPM